MRIHKQADQYGFSRTAVPVDKPLDLYRGLNFEHLLPEKAADTVNSIHADPSQVGPLVHEALGRHWSPDEGVAHSFAQAGTSAHEPIHLEDGKPSDVTTRPSGAWAGTRAYHGIVLKTHVAPEHIVDPDTDEGKHYARAYDIYGRDDSESEHTVRDGSPLHLVSAHYVSAEPVPGDPHKRRFRATPIDLSHLGTEHTASF